MFFHYQLLQFFLQVLFLLYFLTLQAKASDDFNSLRVRLAIAVKLTFADSVVEPPPKLLRLHLQLSEEPLDWGVPPVSRIIYILRLKVGL